MAVDFEDPQVNATPCSLALIPPRFSFGFLLPPIPFPLPFPPPLPMIGFSLSCDPASPINISAGKPYGGGRVAQFDKDPDDEDDIL